ncbi:hypothetical protein DSO57_1020136 [Entomophthora muscae]|uniref:Uncharacterized protein n=1 Tax=Entomophthora muscae TaxID=34485 RepID=A0ACC2TFB4_9FUNG|nr:hypothetical protein DSO57_1020136 [Entomophthora muscae]
MQGSEMFVKKSPMTTLLLKKGSHFSSEPHDKFISEVITSRDEWESEIKKIRNQPALNIMTTSMQNMSGFLPRVTFMRIGFDWLVSIFTWERPLYTWAALLFHTCICLRPIWLVLLPFFAAWVSVLVEITSKEIALEEKDPEINTFIAYKYRSTILGGDVDKAKEKAVEYTLNARFFQNTLGLYVSVYNFLEDKFIQFKALTGPLWPAWLTALGLPPSLYAYCYVSPRIPCLLAGWCCFMATHPLFIAIGSTLATRLYTIFDACLTVSKAALKAKGYDKLFMNASDEVSVEVFENQRWWAVVGWNNSTIATERSSWSDFSGVIAKASTSEYEPNPGYIWKEGSAWELVLDWCDTVSDPEGWVYYNNFWEEPSSAPRFDCFTRRRKWRRTMEAVPALPVPDLS